MKPEFYTVDELVIVCLARTIKDKDIVFNGVASVLPFTAMALAREKHAKNSVFLGGLQGAVNPRFGFLPPVSVDFVFNQNEESMIPVEEIFNWANSGKIDRIFFGGGQIDKFGNANNTVIGSIDEPKVKLPGGAGAPSISCNAKHFTLWSSRHFVDEKSRLGNNFTFVDKVDFVTTVGHVTPQGTREQIGLQGGGPDIVVTDLGVFDFDEKDKTMRLKSVHPHTTLDEIASCTQFTLAVGLADNTIAPDQEEVKFIRELDVMNVRKKLFDNAQLDFKFDF